MIKKITCLMLLYISLGCSNNKTFSNIDNEKNILDKPENLYKLAKYSFDQQNLLLSRNQFMEIRFPAFEAGTKVFIVDQWVETGGTMGAAIKLIEQQGGLVKGVIALAIEENDNTKKLRNNYKCFSAVIPGSEWQKQCNEQYLQSFKSYEPNMAFPKKK